eukprot:191270_1
MFKSVSPAWNDRNLRSLSTVISANLMFAHARAALDPVSISQMNCHPFDVGRFMFMHNGIIAGFSLVKKRMICSLDDRILALVCGTTDSEIAFMIFLNCLFEMKDSLDFDEMEVTAQEMKCAILNTIRNIVRICHECGVQNASSLNFAVTDGNSIVCTRYRNHPTQDPPSLYIAHGVQFGGTCRVGDTICEQFHMHGANTGSTGRSAESLQRTRSTSMYPTVIVSSEPLSYASSDQWHLVPKDHIVVVENTFRQLRADKAGTVLSPALKVYEMPLTFEMESLGSGLMDVRVPSTGCLKKLNLCRSPSTGSIANSRSQSSGDLEDTMSDIYDLLKSKLPAGVGPECLFRVLKQFKPMMNSVWTQSMTMDRLGLDQGKFISRPVWISFFADVASNHRHSAADLERLHAFVRANLSAVCAPETPFTSPRGHPLPRHLRSYSEDS